MVCNVTVGKRARQCFQDTDGFTLVELAVSVLLTMILLLGVGYFTHTAVSRGTASQAYSMQRNADNILHQICLDLHRTDPASFMITSTTMTLPSKIGGPTITYTLSGSPLQFMRNDGTQNYNMLESWDRGRIAVVAGTGFVRGFDVGGDGVVMPQEANMVRITLNLQQMEGDGINEGALNLVPMTFVREVLVSD